MLRKLVSGASALLTAVSAIPISAFLVSAEETAFPYTIFASSDSENAIDIHANYGCINGKLASNGTVSAAGLQVNGQIIEHAEQDMIFVLRKLNETYFQTESVVLSDTDYTQKKTNLTVKNPVKSAGSVSLSGNINLKTQIMAAGDIALTGNSLNTTTAALISENGDITAEMGNFNFSGLIYAPNGDVVITADNISLNSVVVIAQTVTLNGSGVNAGRNTGMADLIGTESDDPVVGPDDPVNKPPFLVIAKYDETASAVVLQWDQPEGISSFAVHGSADGSSFRTLADVTDAGTYTYAVSDDFEEQYFTVSYTDADGETVESPAVCVKRTEAGIVVLFTDTDGDGLDDPLELLYGTDINKADTDEDGLSDFDEVFRTGTDPAVFDSVTEGVSDADADTDSDGLTNLEEITLGTDPRKADTDGEGLSDGDEVNLHHTDPLLPDTDKDGVDDASEITLGLDPLKDKTFGDADASHVFPQTVAADSDAFLIVNTADSPYDLSVSLNTNLLAAKNLRAEESSYAVSVANDAMLGMCTALDFDPACTVSDVVLTFAIRPEYRDNTLGTFADLADMEGIKRLCVFAYDEELNMLVPVETEYDTEHFTISAAVDGSGSYCVMDLEIWLDLLGVKPEDLTEEDSDAAVAGEPDAEPAAAAPRRTALKAAAPAPTTTAPAYATYSFNGSRYALFEMNMSWDDCKAYCESLGGHLATITSAEEQAFLNSTVLPHGNKNTYYIGLTRANAFSNWHWITGEPVTYYNWDSGEPNYDNEHWVHIYRRIKTRGKWNNTQNYVSGTWEYSTYMAGCICEWESEAPADYNIIVGTNFKTGRLLTALRENSLVDTDGDSISDWQEANTALLTIRSDGTVTLPALQDLFDSATISAILNRTYTNEAVRRGMAATFKNKKVLPCVTDPTSADTDGDGYADVSDPFPNRIPEGLEGEYDFMHNEVYALKAVSVSDDIRLDSGNTAGVLTASYFKSTDVQKFRFVWCGDGYKIFGLNTSKVLTVRPDATQFTAFMETDRNADEQKWEVLPYYNEDDNRLGIVIRSKVFDFTRNPLGDPIYLNYQNQSRIGVLRGINRYSVFGIANMADWTLMSEWTDFGHDGRQWIRFGELYMQYHGWIDYTINRDEESLNALNRAFMNYILNKRYKFDSDNYVKDTDTNLDMLSYQHDPETFENMNYADSPMSDVACEIIGTYNAIRMAEGSDSGVKFLRLAVEFEMSGIRKNILNGVVTNEDADTIYSIVQYIESRIEYAKQRNADPNAVYSLPNFKHLTTSFTNDGGWGSWPQLIQNCLNAYYLKYQIVHSDSEFDTEIKKAGVKCGIQSYSFSSFGIHTYAVNYRNTDSMLHAYNFYCGKDCKDKAIASTADLVKLCGADYYWGYILK